MVSFQGTENRKKEKLNYRQFRTFFHFSKCTSILILLRAMAFLILITYVFYMALKQHDIGC